MTNEQTQEQQANPNGQQAIPAEVLNAELIARLDFTEQRLVRMATVAFNLQAKCDALVAALAERTAEIAALRGTPAKSGKAAKSEVGGA